MIESPICDLLGIRYPLFQGGMAWIADAGLASAVSNAGGFGIIAAGNQRPDEIREQIHMARELTDKPFGLNIMLMSRYADDIAALASEERISAVTTGAGNPAKYMEAWKEAGIKVIPVIASVAMAKLMARLGASAVIAEGCESGGHVGELTTMVLVPLICDAVDVPVIAAGGIADGRQAAAAFMLGACGIQMGTRFLSATECSVHPVYKQKILKANDLSTLVTGKKINHAVRALRTQFVRDSLKLEYSDAPAEDLEAFTAGKFRLAVREGDIENGCFLSGQAAAMVRKEEPAADIIRDVMEGAESCLKRELGLRQV